MLNEKEEKIQKMIDEGITLVDFIDYVVKVNGFVGVGLISLADGLADYIKSKINRRSADEILNDL